MRIIDLKLIITCVPHIKQDGTIYCDNIGGCNACFKKTFSILEKTSKDIENFKIEKFDITRIIDLKKRKGT